MENLPERKIIGSYGDLIEIEAPVGDESWVSQAAPALEPSSSEYVEVDGYLFNLNRQDDQTAISGLKRINFSKR